VSYIGFTGNIVEVDKSISSVYDTLCAENDTVFFFIFQRTESGCDFFDSVLTAGFSTEAGEYFIGMVVSVFVMMASAITVFVMFMVVASAIAVFIVLMVMVFAIAVLVVLMVIFALAVFIVLVMMASALTMFIMLVMVMFALAVLIVLMVMMLAIAVFVMFVMVMTAFTVLIMLMMVMMLVHFFCQLLQFVFESVFLFENLENLRAGELFPGCGENFSFGVVFSQERYAGFELCIGGFSGVAENDRSCTFDLVVEEFAEVLHVHLALVYINNSCCGVQGDIVSAEIKNRLDDIAELAHTGGFDDDAVGGIVCENLTESLAEIAYKTAADTAGVHFGDVHAGILQKSAVDADIAEFVFDEHQLFSAVCFSDELFDECCFSGAEEAGEYINFRHIFYLPWDEFGINHHYIIHQSALACQGENDGLILVFAPPIH